MPNAKGVVWLHWPCGQNPGRKPDGHQRALAREAMSLGEQRSDLQGQPLWQALSEPRTTRGVHPRCPGTHDLRNHAGIRIAKQVEMGVLVSNQ